MSDGGGAEAGAEAGGLSGGTLGKAVGAIVVLGAAILGAKVLYDWFANAQQKAATLDPAATNQATSSCATPEEELPINATDAEASIEITKTSHETKEEEKSAPTLTPEAEAELLKRAEAARDALANEWKKNKRYQPATVVGAYNIETGEVAAAASSNRNPSSNGNGCAEDHVVDKLGGDKSKIKFTRATRPSNGRDIPVCERCEETYGRDPFPKDTNFKSDDKPD